MCSMNQTLVPFEGEPEQANGRLFKQSVFEHASTRGWPTLAAGERILESFAPDMSAPVRLWSLAQLSVLTNVSAYFKDAYIYLMTKAAKPSELSKLWWASSTLGLQNVAFGRRVEQLSSSALSKFQLEELLAVSMGACTSDASTDFLLNLSEELQSRLQTLSPSSEAKTRRVLQDIMGVLWAINFAAALSPKLLRSAEQATKRLATFLDSVSQPSTVSIPSMGTDGPELCLDLADRMVITKPPGWEVYGQSQLQLLSFIQAQRWLTIPRANDNGLSLSR